MAAARNVSAAHSRTLRPSDLKRLVSLPMVVVLPVPLTPTTRMTSGTPSTFCGGVALLWSRMARRIDRRLRADRLMSEAGDRRQHKPLTRREQYVLRGVFEGLPSKQIAADLGVSEGAVKATLQHLFRKTQP